MSGLGQIPTSSEPSGGAALARRYDYVIVGSSVAAVAAVEAIRGVDGTGSVLVLGEEKVAAYSRPLISHHFAGKRDVVDMIYPRPGFWDKMGTTVRIGTRVVSCDLKRKTVTTDKGDDIGYGVLLLATGSRPGVPPIEEGLELDGVFTLTNLEDSQNIKEYLPRVRRVCVIGGGLIGLQAAEALIELGRQVTVVEFMERILGRVFDDVASSVVEELFREHGAEIMTRASARRIVPSQSGPARVGEVVLQDGTRIPADMVIVATGVAPRKELADAAGIETNVGILVDRFMRTSALDVFAAGDVAEGHDLLTGTRRAIPLWPNAYLQGRIAGLNMAGRQTTFPGGVAMNAAHFFGFPAVSAGIFDPSADAEYDVLQEYRPEKKTYRKLVTRNGCPVGFIFTGDAVDRSGVILGLIRARVGISDCKEELFKCPGLAALPEPLRREMMKRYVQM